MEFLWFIVIGALAGWLAGQFIRGRGFGLLGDIVIGIMGAFIGGLLVRSLGVSLGGGLIVSLIVAFVGALLLLFVLRLIRGKDRRHRMSS